MALPFWFLPCSCVQRFFTILFSPYFFYYIHFNYSFMVAGFEFFSQPFLVCFFSFLFYVLFWGEGREGGACLGKHAGSYLPLGRQHPGHHYDQHKSPKVGQSSHCFCMPGDFSRPQSTGPRTWPPDLFHQRLCSTQQGVTLVT